MQVTARCNHTQNSGSLAHTLKAKMAMVHLHTQISGSLAHTVEAHVVF